MATIQIKIPDWLDKICAWPAMWYRKRKYGYAFRRIDLGEGEFTIVDADIYYRLGRFKWSAAGHDEKFYAVSGIKTGRKKIKLQRLHREIINAPHGLLVDHRNGDSLDNRRANLRLATSSQNHCNNVIDKSNSLSQYRGVTLKKKSGRFVAQITSQGINYYLGSFGNEIDAARAYDEAAKKCHGEFAKLNFPQK